jgi:TetR/AcrR family transcriptional regulator, cholesterol catabolism regulator
METRRDQIDTVASALFRERGYAATSVRDIARALDIQGASLYSHVASKEDVLWSIVQRAAERFHSDVRPLAEQPGPAAERLRAMCRSHVRVVTADVEHASVFLNEWRSLGEARRNDAAGLRDSYEELFRRVIRDGSRAGEFRAVDAAVAAASILSALNGVADWYRHDGRLSAAAISDQLAEMAVRSLVSEGVEE